MSKQTKKKKGRPLTFEEAMKIPLEELDKRFWQKVEQELDDALDAIEFGDSKISTTKIDQPLE